MKDLSKVKGTLHGWTEESCIWYDTASEYTGYHDRLAAMILRHLRPEYSCCEIACGTGNLARKLARRTAAFTANDVDSRAVAFLSDKLRSPGEPDVEVLLGKWQDQLAGRHFDALIMSYCSIKKSEWPEIKDLAGKKFIAVLPADRRMNTDGPDPERLGSLAEFSVFLESEGVPYTEEPVRIEFGQPFSDMDEARRYVRHYYRLEGEDLDRFTEMKVARQADGTLYFPKKKDAVLITADLS